MANLATINNNILADSGIDPLSLIVGTGTVNYVPKFTAEDTVANSQIFDNGTNVGIGTSSPSARLHVATSSTTGTTSMLILSRASGYGQTLFEQTYDSTYFTAGKTLTLKNDAGTAFIHFAGNNAGTQTNVLIPTGNVGIGTGTPTSKLELYNSSGDTRMTVTSTGGTGASDLLLKNASGTVAYEWYVQALGADGRFRIFDNTGGSTGERFTIDQSGNVGIGTSSPTQKLEVNGTIKTGGNGSGYVEGYRIIWETPDIHRNVGANAYQIENVTSQGLSFGYSSSIFMTLSTSGNLGIGTTSPNHQLAVYAGGGRTATTAINAGNSNVIPAIAIQSGVTTWASATNGFAYYYNSTNGNLDLYRKDGAVTTEYQVMTWVRANGNVGIGTASPTSIGTGVTTLDIQGSNAGGIAFGPSGTKNYIYGASTMYIEANSTAVFATGGSERMRITSSGDLYVGGTTDAYSQANRKVLSLNGVDDSLISFRASGTAYGYIYAYSSALDVSAINRSLTFSTGGSPSERMRITNAGSVGIGTSSPQAKLQVSNSTSDGIIVSTTANVEPFLAFWRNSASNGVGVLRLIDGGSLYFDNGATGASQATKMQIAPTGAVRFNAYGSGSFTGTVAYNLAVDSSGNIIETAGGVVDGSGTANYVPLWSDPNTLTNSAIYQTGGGNVGINTASPAYKLDINGTARAAGMTLNAFATGTSGGNLELGFDGTQGVVQAYNRSASWIPLFLSGSDVRFYPAGTEQMRLTTTGLGIGTTSPGTKLHINDVNSAYTFLYSTISGGSPIALDNTSGNLDIYTASTTRMRITSGGNVGIGTTSPLTKLHVSGSISAEYSDSIYLDYSPSVGSYKKGFSGLNQSSGVARGLHIFNYDNDSNQGINFWVGTNASKLQAAVIKNNRQVLFNAYGSGSFTGTRAYDLSVDASGNIIEVAIGAGTITGSGTTNYIPKFTSSSAIGNSIVQDYGDNVWVGTNTAGYGTLNIQRFTSAPYATLTLTDQATPSNPIGLYLRSNGSSPVGISSAGAPIAFYTGGPATNEGMRLDASGNLLIGLSSALANGKLQVAGSIGLSGNTQIRQATNSDGNTLQVFATQVIAGNLNSYSYGYSGGGLLASVSAGDSILLFDAGRTTSTEGRVKIANTTLGNVSFSVEKNGVTTLFASTLGNVGIGSANPQVKLDVQSGSIGAYHNTASSGGAQLYLGDMNFAGGAYATSAPGVGAVYGPTHLVAGDLAFYVYNGVASSRSEAMRIIRHSSGNNYVGIGTTTPTTKLHVLSSDNTYANLVIAATSNNGNVTGGLTFGGLYNSDALNFYTGASSITKMYISNAGNVGIGTTSPGAELVINSANSNTRFFVQNAGSTKIELGHGPTGYGFTHPTGQFLAYADNLYFGQLSGISTNVTFTGGGNVLIGTTSDAGYKLDVNGMGRYSGQLTVDYSSADAVIRLSKGASSIGNIDFVNEGNRFSIQDDGTRRLVIDLSGNVGIGTTSPNGSGWDESSTVLHIYKNTINGGLLKLESSNTTAIFNAGNDQLAIFTTTDDPIRFGTNGSERMRITSGGNVGIGTSSPQAKLDVIGVGVFGTMTSSRSTYSNGLSLQNNTGEATSLFLWQSGVASAHIGSPANSTSLHIVNSYNTGLITDPNSIVLTSTGKVGIGTTSPAYKLEVSLPTTTSDIVQRWTSPSYDSVDLYIGSSQAYFGTLSTTPLAFRTANTERMRITSAGLVGIGTSNPANILSIKNGAAQLDINTTTSTVTLEAIDRGNTGNSVDIGYYARNGSHIFYNGAYAERMRVTSGGQVGINTSSPEQLFTVAGGSISVSGNTGLPRQILELTTASTVSIVRASYQGMGSFGDLALWTGGSERMRITSGGNVGIGTTSPNAKLEVKS